MVNGKTIEPTGVVAAANHLERVARVCDWVVDFLQGVALPAHLLSVSAGPALGRRGAEWVSR